MLRYFTADALQQYHGIFVGSHFLGGRSRPTREKGKTYGQLDELGNTPGRHTPGVTVFALFGHKDLASGAEGPMNGPPLPREAWDKPSLDCPTTMTLAQCDRLRNSAAVLTGWVLKLPPMRHAIGHRCETTRCQRDTLGAAASDSSAIFVGGALVASARIGNGVESKPLPRAIPGRNAIAPTGNMDEPSDRRILCTIAVKR
jgi:hypothetical protein